LISNAANLQVIHFLEGPARHLMREEAKAKFGSRIRILYQTAAKISFEMWMGKPTLRCHNLRLLGQRAFDPDDKDFIPNSLIRYENFEDQLKGKPISLILHPLLEVYGTNDAKDHDHGSVWVPGEVWLDSRKANPVIFLSRK
jgi:hypothetical protein